MEPCIRNIKWALRNTRTGEQFVVQVGWDTVEWAWRILHATMRGPTGVPEVLKEKEKLKMMNASIWASSAEEAMAWRVEAMLSPEYARGKWVTWTGSVEKTGVPLSAILGSPVSAGGEVAVIPGVLAALYALPPKTLGKTTEAGCGTPGWFATRLRFTAAYITHKICWDTVGPAVPMDMFPESETQLHITRSTPSSGLPTITTTTSSMTQTPIRERMGEGDEGGEGMQSTTSISTSGSTSSMVVMRGKGRTVVVHDLCSLFT